jgi:hypothetical protein
MPPYVFQHDDRIVDDQSGEIVSAISDGSWLKLSPPTIATPKGLRNPLLAAQSAASPPFRSDEAPGSGSPHALLSRRRA